MEIVNFLLTGEGMSFKSFIKKSFLGNYLISLSHCVRCKIEPALISDEKAVKKYYKKTFGKELDLDNPTTFTEKTNWYKLNNRNPLMAKCADKVAVRDYIKEKGYGDCLNEIIGVYDRVNEIDFDSLPDQFVIKASHGSHMSYIVKDKSSFDWKNAKKMMKTWLHQNIYWSGREWVYKDIPKRIIIEKYLEDENGELRDYKFYCFNGKPDFIQYDIGRYSHHYRNFYDLEFNALPFKNGCEQNFEIDIEKPNSLQKMITIAKVLAEPFQFARVDFYSVYNRIVFGEITFFHEGGSTPFEPNEYEEIIGNKWRLVK